jgi:glutaminyl-peptide cyclotransferase
MKKSYLKYWSIIVIALLVTLIISCSGRAGNSSAPVSSEVNGTVTTLQTIITIKSPDAGSAFSTGDIIKIEFEPDNANDVPDSVVVYFNGNIINTIKRSPWSYIYRTDIKEKTGRASVKLIAYSGKKKPQVITRFVTLLSDITPKIYHYKVVNVFPHDRNAYTQGLVYDGAVLYEGTGVYDESDLRKVDLKTGKIIKQQKIEGQFFGEGIAILNEKLYQLTWTSKVGFAYDKNSFQLKNKFYYQTEGWGLSVYNGKLVMSDGTNIIYFMEPELFTVLSSIEVYDNKGAVNQLNELEVINGEIWANIYQTDTIARIDPNTGKVLAYIDLGGILPQADRQPTTDVLNGIAWDQAQNRIFVTGKLWPKLFEIKLTE